MVLESGLCQSTMQETERNVGEPEPRNREERTAGSSAMEEL
jgi:hypothetical protein